jgi:hypothetical protein
MTPDKFLKSVLIFYVVTAYLLIIEVCLNSLYSSGLFKKEFPGMFQRLSSASGSFLKT